MPPHPEQPLDALLRAARRAAHQAPEPLVRVVSAGRAPGDDDDATVAEAPLNPEAPRWEPRGSFGGRPRAWSQEPSTTAAVVSPPMAAVCLPWASPARPRRWAPAAVCQRYEGRSLFYADGEPRMERSPLPAFVRDAAYPSLLIPSLPSLKRPSEAALGPAKKARAPDPHEGFIELLWGAEAKEYHARARA